MPTGTRAMAKDRDVRGPSFQWTGLVALALAALGSWYAVTHGGLEGADPLTIRARLERGEVVELEALPARVAARFAAGWGGVPGERIAEGAGVAVVVRTLEATGEDARARLAEAGFEPRGAEWFHPATGISIPASRACAVVAGPRREGLEVALVRPSGFEDDVAVEIAGALSAGPLPTARRTWLFDGPHLALEVWAGGAEVNDSMAVDAGPEGPGAERFDVAALAPALERIDARFRVDGIPVAAAPTVRWIAARATGGPSPAAAGRFDAASNELVVAAGVREALDDALRSFVAARLLDAFGAPADAWLLEGYASWLAAGDEGASAPSAAAEVTGEIAAAPAARRAVRAGAVRALLEEGDARLVDLVRRGVDSAALSAVLVEVGAEPVVTADRPASLQPGVFLRYGGSVRAGRRVLGTARGAEELARFAELGAAGVMLEVHVPVPPRANEPGESRPASLLRPGGREWGTSLTLEGDGAVLMAAAQARRAGLRVVLVPRPVASPSGPLTGQQVNANSPAKLARIAVAMEGMAGLARRAGAEGLVVLDRFHFPVPPEQLAALPEPERVAYEGAFDLLVNAARGFDGALLALTDAMANVALLAERGGAAGEIICGLDRYPAGTALGGTVRAEGAGLLQLTVHGTTRAFDGPDGWGSGADETLRTEVFEALASALERDRSIPVIVLRGWVPGGDAAVDTNLSRATATALRGVFRTR